MRSVRALSATLLLAAAATLGAAHAEDLDVPGLFDSAKASFGEKKYGKCLGDLTLLATEVGRLRVEGLTVRMPAAPAGWAAEDAEGNGGLGLLGLGSMTVVRRRYTKGEDTSVNAEVYADAPAMRGPFEAMVQNAALMGGAGMKVVTLKGRKALEQVDASNRSGSLIVLLKSANSMLKLEGSAISKDDLAAVANAFDLDALEKALSE